MACLRRERARALDCGAVGARAEALGAFPTVCVNGLRTENIALAAAELGYYDQAHMLRFARVQRARPRRSHLELRHVSTELTLGCFFMGTLR
jgi:hypothetical protein